MEEEQWKKSSGRNGGIGDAGGGGSGDSDSDGSDDRHMETVIINPKAVVTLVFDRSLRYMSPLVVLSSSTPSLSYTLICADPVPTVKGTAIVD